MHALASLRNNIDTTDSFYKSAYVAASTAFWSIMDYQDALLYAFSKSPARKELKNLYK